MESSRHDHTHPYQRILVPLDGSRLAEAALPPAIYLAKHLGAVVTLLHVLEHDAPGTVHGEKHLAASDESERYLTGLASTWQGDGVTVEWHVHPNPEHDVARSIADHAAELGADLIVITTHGSGGLRGFLFGSIAQQVLRRTDRPVLIVRPEQLGEAGFTCRRIVVPLDGTADAERALPLARELAHTAGATLRLVRVVPTVGTIRGERSVPSTMLPTATAALLDMQQEEARDYLSAMCASFAQDVTVEMDIRRGDVADAVARAVHDSHADLTLLSTHGRAGIESLVTGSIAARIISRVDSPVLLVRAE
jgi:nucleotide-binding universal stress UspA family protein